ncbi:para-aminobenzoate synthase, component I [Parvularcula bermudensis HTCC2503]|uniref:Para-aminobenzoate synthase, component I n=1 Tax=Parvularcula bermudensis (strain ATCC BAA-594 / HTCC2503 / KCTC 12087) TaxID=314260 RepID=E0TCI0_PARBH|nr:aminodeoxychorismate/anthranilate synthase component II [Parvularcula bermudensis]ADM10336.1 para-aminobenzoate synthase, component I [Parvularcula bermudensis HTCC2503]
MRLALVDNDDSFTNNLVHLFRLCGADEVVVFRNERRSLASLQSPYWHGILLSAGPGDPRRPDDIGIMPDLIARADRPIFGVCLGFQVLALAAGGRLVQMPTPIHGQVTPIHHEKRGGFANLVSPFSATRYHSWGITDLPATADLCQTRGARTDISWRRAIRSVDDGGCSFILSQSALTAGAISRQRFLANVRRVRGRHVRLPATDLGQRFLRRGNASGVAMRKGTIGPPPP